MAFGVGQPAQTTLSGEIVPAERRLHASACCSVAFVFGEIYAAILIWIDDPQMKHLDWKWLLIMGAIPAVILLVIAVFCLYESPVFLAQKGRKNEAWGILDHMRRLNRRPNAEIDFE